ncbi:hypothetical protein A7U60_g332 [Sanghuangporus baumii]|uniref:Uncharacterized protein n=1 Tax=Sanghuangporus baumii TaxID=108892 RepID=A0A9Q5NA86_SANBA|nr:hypothetical protein A7U60_g332 [Sanghuangporus baumii]
MLRPVLRNGEGNPGTLLLQIFNAYERKPTFRFGTYSRWKAVVNANSEYLLEIAISIPKNDVTLSQQTLVDMFEQTSISDLTVCDESNSSKSVLEKRTEPAACKARKRKAASIEHEIVDQHGTIEEYGRERDPSLKSSPKRRRSDTNIVSRKNTVAWKVFDMTRFDSRPSDARIPPNRKPYLWSQNYEELLGAIPLLSVVNNGVCADDNLSPMILLTNIFWIGDWDGSDTMKLRTMRSFPCFEPTPKPHPIFSEDCLNQLESSTERYKTSDAQSGEDEETASEAELQYLIEDEVPIESDRRDDLSTAQIFALVSSWGSRDNSCNNSGEIVVDSEETNVLRTPEGYPEEISTLIKAYKGGMPVSVIMEAAWTGSPFQLYDECAFAVLGFFHIIDLQINIAHPSSTPKKNGTHFARGQMTWSFTLRWLPSGPLDLDIPVDLDGRPHDSPSVPWWSASVSIPETSTAPTVYEDLYEPFFVGSTIVAQSILREAYDGANGRTDASKRSWLCRRCGKISLANWIGNYACSYCDNRVSGSGNLFQSSSVRDRYRFLPMWEPSMQVPKGVTRSSVLLERGYKRFTFTLPREFRYGHSTYSNVTIPSTERNSGNSSDDIIKWNGKEREKGPSNGLVTASPADQDEDMRRNEPSLVVEMFFLGNREKLERDANADFIAFQKECPMRFEKTDGRGTAGIYTYRVDPDRKSEHTCCEGYSDWSSVPSCIKSATERMSSYAKLYLGRDVDLALQHVLAMAWLGESPVKKAIPIRAKQNPTMLMCLGADLDIVFPKSGDMIQQKSPSKFKSRSRKSVLIDTEEEHTETSRAGKYDEIWTNAYGCETTKALTSLDRFRLTMTHGSIVVVSGDDIVLTVIRTEFAILLRLSDGQ